MALEFEGISEDGMWGVFTVNKTCHVVPIYENHLHMMWENGACMCCPEVEVCHDGTMYVHQEIGNGKAASTKPN